LGSAVATQDGQQLIAQSHGARLVARMGSASVRVRSALACAMTAGEDLPVALLLAQKIVPDTETVTMESASAHLDTLGLIAPPPDARTLVPFMETASTTHAFAKKVSQVSTAHSALAPTIAMGTDTVMTELAIVSLAGLELSALCWDALTIAWATDGVTRELAAATLDSRDQTVWTKAALMDARDTVPATLTTLALVTRTTLASIAH